MAESEARTVARGLRWSKIKSFQVSFNTHRYKVFATRKEPRGG